MRERIGHGRDVVESFTLSKAFVADKEECFAFGEVTPEVAPKLVADEWWNRLVWNIEVIFRVECVVAEEFKERSVQRILPRFRNHLHDGASVAAIFRFVIVREDAKFLDPVDAKKLAGNAARRKRVIGIVDIHAVDGVVRRCGALAVHRKLGKSAFLQRTRPGARSGRDARFEKNEL
jgi:hypothetical protein